MFNTHTDFALNKFDGDAIVCQSVSGPDIRITREDFTSDEEFNYWKKLSDDDYREIDRIGREDGACLSFEEQRGVQVPSAEEVVLTPYIETEQKERRCRMLEQIRTSLTAKQYRRLCLYYLEGKDEMEIAFLEHVNQSSISRAISRGTKIVEGFYEEFFCGTA